MARKYKKSNSRVYISYTKENLEKAIAAIHQGASYRTAFKRFHIPLGTLSNKVNGNHNNKVGRPTVLTEKEEEAIVSHVLVCADWGFPMNMFELRMIIRSYLNFAKKKISQFANNLPGPDFALSFLNRNRDKFRLRTVSNYSRKRASLSSTVINEYFDHLEHTLSGVPPENIFNYDETNLSDNPGKKKALVRRGSKYPQRVMNETKSAISIMVCGSAAGELLPLYVCYKSKTGIFNTWRMGGPKGTRYGRSLSGWFDGPTFEDWFRTIALPKLKKKPGVKVMLGDNLSSHFSPEVIRLCKQHNIKFVCLPPNSTDVLQPLDKAFFAPVKRIWRALISAYKTDHPKESSVKKDKFPQLLSRLWDEVLLTGSENLKSGFRHCLHRETILRAHGFESCESDVYTYVSQAVLDALKERRFSGTLTSARRTAVRCPPGASLTNMESSSESGSEEENQDSNQSEEEDDVNDDEGDDGTERMEGDVPDDESADPVINNPVQDVEDEDMDEEQGDEIREQVLKDLEESVMVAGWSSSFSLVVPTRTMLPSSSRGMAIGCRYSV